jgi:hypothetical protein
MFVASHAQRAFRAFRSALRADQLELFTEEQVRDLLRPDSVGPAASRSAVLTAASISNLWLATPSGYRRTESLRLAYRIPSILFWYSRGASVDEIRLRLGEWSVWAVEDALRAACSLLPAHLNATQAERRPTATRGELC